VRSLVFIEVELFFRRELLPVFDTFCLAIQLIVTFTYQMHSKCDVCSQETVLLSHVMIPG
jgi:hypothetical protein